MAKWKSNQRRILFMTSTLCEKKVKSDCCISCSMTAEMCFLILKSFRFRLHSRSWVWWFFFSFSARLAKKRIASFSSQKIADRNIVYREIPTIWFKWLSQLVKQSLRHKESLITTACCLLSPPLFPFIWFRTSCMPGDKNYIFGALHNRYQCIEVTQNCRQSGILRNAVYKQSCWELYLNQLEAHYRAAFESHKHRNAFIVGKQRVVIN